MKLYLSTDYAGAITSREVWQAAQAAAMSLDNMSEHGSRYADVSGVIEFNGYGTEDIHSARRPNTRDSWVRSNEYAATWDQWGVLLSRLFVLDPDMRVGSYKYPYYDGAESFGFATNWRFDRVFSLQALTDYHGDHSWKPSLPREHQCRKCDAIRRWAA